VTWDDPFKPTQNVFYILYPRASSTITSSGNCPETDALILAAGKWTSQLHDEIFVFDDGSWDKSKALWESVKNASWSDVILEPQMKKNLIEDVQGFFDSQALYAQYAVPWKRGIILHGVPGNGKTVSIKALMSSLYDRPNPPIPSLYVKSFKTMCYTEQYAIHSIFDMARSMAPCLLIFEDLDSLVNDSVRSYFLNEVDGVESNDGILMIGSTNHLDTLDPAISKRPSRFDRKYHFKLPELEERKSYAEYWRGKLEKHNTVDFPAEVTDIIAQLTDKFSFAYLKELFVMALLSLVRGVKDEDLAEVVEEKKEDEKPAAAEPEKQEEEEKCTCVAKCKDCGKPLPKESAEAKDEKTEAKDEESTEKMVMPTVEIPEHLKENLLLKVIKHHIGVMIAEMDNTKDYEGKKKTEAVKESCCD
jgi:transitional endoplasmic reticulum ATPase